MKKLYLLLLIPAALILSFPLAADKRPSEIRITESKPGNLADGHKSCYKIAYNAAGRPDSIVYISWIMYVSPQHRSIMPEYDTIVYRFSYLPRKTIVDERSPRLFDDEYRRYTFHLDDAGRADTLIDDRNGYYLDTTLYSYDAAGHLSVEARLSRGEKNETMYLYNAAGDLVRVHGYQSNWPYTGGDCQTTIQSSSEANTGSLLLPLSEMANIETSPLLCLGRLGGKAAATLPLMIRRKSTNHPDWISGREYFYTFDAGHYPTHIEELLTEYDDDEGMMWTLDITWTDTGGVQGTGADEDDITLQGRTVSASAPLTVYDAQGRVIASAGASESITLPCAGIYLLRTARTCRKVAVL